MKKYVCAVCGWTTEAEAAPAECPICKAKKFTEHEIGGELVYAAEHKVGICEGIDPEIIKGLRDNFTGECTEVGMYLAMARVAHREGYPELGLSCEKAAYD